MLSQILAVSSSITTPLGLAGLTVIVLYGIYKAVFEARLLVKIDSAATTVLLKRIVNWVGIVALTAVLLVLSVPLLKVLIAKADDGKVGRDIEVSQMVSAMLASYTEGAYAEADNAANKILEFDPKNYRALSMKGAVAFYRSDYRGAAEYFKLGLASKPGEPTMTKNLAEAYVELGAYELALEKFHSVSTGGDGLMCATGRAYFYADRYDEALKYLQGVPTSYQRGHARVLEAATIVLKARTVRVTDAKSALMLQAERKLKEGRGQNREYWDGMFSGRMIDIHQGYSKAQRVLRDMYARVSSEKD